MANAPNQYLAWGGESDGYSVVSVEQIRKDLAQESASGTRNWTRFALIGPRVRNPADPHQAHLAGAPADWPETWPVEVRGVGRSTHDDYVTETFILVTPYGEVLDEFSATHDGRVMAAQINLSVADTQRLAAIVAEWGSVDDLVIGLAMRRRTTPTMTAREILDAYNLKVITRIETRKMLGIGRPAAARR